MIGVLISLFSKLHSGEDDEQRNGNQETNKKELDYDSDNDTYSTNDKIVVEDSNKKVYNCGIKNELTAPKENNNVVENVLRCSLEFDVVPLEIETVVADTNDKDNAGNTTTEEVIEDCLPQ